MMKQRLIIFVSILLSCTGVSALGQSQPNILFIFADDWGYGDLSCHGHAYVKTPNIDRLAEEGIEFTNFTVASAICSPSRTGVLTGCFPARFNVTGHFHTPKYNEMQNQGDWVDPELVMLPRLLRQAGYATAHFGKWHLSSALSDAPVPNVYGYDEVAAFNSSAPRTPVHHDAQNAIAFIEKSHNEGKPFFINMWLHEPHTPFHTLPEYLERFSDLDEADKIYASVLSHADDRIGEVLDELDRLGLKENTLVIFSSDNGPAGSGKKGGKITMDKATGIVSGHGPCVGTTGGRKGRKGTLWQGGIGLPFIARWPGKIPAGEVDDVSWISAVDLLPTFCEVAGVTLPPDYHPDGISLLATLKGEKTPLREKPLFWKRQAIGKGAGTGADYAILDGKWKLLASINSDEVELYDVSIDPYEKYDVQEEHPELVLELVKKLEAWKATLPAHPDPKCLSKERGNSLEVDQPLDSVKEVAGVATEFYVSNAGNDTWDGTSAEYKGGTKGPWKTLDKVNQQMELLEGGTVLFHSGDQFNGMLVVRGNNLRFGAYGEGKKPVFSGAQSLTGDWSAVPGSDNLYKILLPSDVSDVAFLLRECTSLPLGRTPNGDLLTNAAFYDFGTRTMTSVTDPELTDAEELAGAEIVLRQNVWKYSTYQITSVDGTTVNFLNKQRPTRKKGDENLKEAGYFFQKHIKTLDVDGEWFFDEKNHNLYLYSDTKPVSKSFRYSVYPIVINIDNSKDIALQSLRIELAGSMGMKVADSWNIEIKNCDIALCGQEGISVQASSAHIEGNNISDCMSGGIRTSGQGRVVVTRNALTNIGLIAGRGSGRNGIYLNGGNSEASYNRLSNIGYLGIQHLNGRNLIRRNVIDTYNLVTFDGGAIYTHNDQKGSVVEENIIMNGMPNTVGLGKSIISMEEPFSTGIQMDRGTENLIVRNNTIRFTQINYQDRGIHINFNSVDNLIMGNTILVKGAGITTLDRDPYDRKPGEESPPSMSGNRFEENIIISTSTSNIRANYGALTAFSLKETEQCDVENQGVFRNNVCALPFKKEKIINEFQSNCNPGRTPSDHWFDTAAEWNDDREYASGNLDAPVKIDESSAPKDFIQLFYNDSDNPKFFPLSEGDYLDPWGKPISGSVTVAPWRSAILFKVQ